MTQEEFENLVAEMRQIQRKLNYGGMSQLISKAHKLEKQVDEYIKEHREPVKENKLF